MKLFYLVELLSPYRVEWMNLLSEKFEVYVFYFDENERTREQKWLESVDNNFKKCHVENKVICGIRISNDVFKILEQDNYDIYIIDGYASFAQVKVIRWLTKRNKKVFVNVDGIDIWRRETILSRLKGVIKSGVYKSGAKFLCGSRIAADRIISLGANNKNVFTHPFTSLHESDIIVFEQKEKYQENYKLKINAKDKRVVVAAGRFIPLKRYDVLIKAWKNMPDDCILFLIGGGELRQEYEEIIRDLSIPNIKIIDYLDKEKLNEFYLAADLFVHTSETEVWGLVLNEAMAKGCPVISTDHCVGGVELIRNGIEGYIVKVGNVDELNRRMKDIVCNEQVKKQMMKNSIERISPYTFENLAKIHIGIFKEITR